jgi:hypothetical protein
MRLRIVRKKVRELGVQRREYEGLALVCDDPPDPRIRTPFSVRTHDARQALGSNPNCARANRGDRSKAGSELMPRSTCRARAAIGGGYRCEGGLRCGRFGDRLRPVRGLLHRPPPASRRPSAARRQRSSPVALLALGPISARLKPRKPPRPGIPTAPRSVHPIVLRRSAAEAVVSSETARFCCVTWSSWLTPVLISLRPLACSAAAEAISSTKLAARCARSRISDSASPAWLTRLDPCLHLLGALRDQFLDFARGIRGALRQEPDLGGDHGKSATCIACARRFHAGVQGQKVGLKRDVVDHTDDARDLFGALLDPLHRFNGLPDDFAPLCAPLPGSAGWPPPRPPPVRRSSAH